MNITTPKTLAAFLGSRRKELNLTQVKASELAAIKQQTLSNLELKPDGSKIETLFRVLSSLKLELHLIPIEDSQICDEDALEW